MSRNWFPIGFDHPDSNLVPRVLSFSTPAEGEDPGKEVVLTIVSFLQDSPKWKFLPKLEPGHFTRRVNSLAPFSSFPLCVKYVSISGGCFTFLWQIVSRSACECSRLSSLSNRPNRLYCINRQLSRLMDGKLITNLSSTTC